MNRPWYEDNLCTSPNCREPCKAEAKFCSKCRMVLTYDAYNVTLEEQKEKESELNTMKKDLQTIKVLLQTILHGSTRLMSQEQQTALAQVLYQSGWLLNEKERSTDITGNRA